MKVAVGGVAGSGDDVVGGRTWEARMATWTKAIVIQVDHTRSHASHEMSNEIERNSSSVLWARRLVHVRSTYRPTHGSDC